MNKGAFILVVMCLFFPSCLKKNHKQDTKTSTPAYFIDDDFTETVKREQHFGARKRAQFNQSAQINALGIPYMIDAEFIKQNSENNNLCIEYKTKYNVSSITSFYEQEMEFLGWQKLFLYEQSSLEALLVFTKPQKTIVVQAKKDKSRYKVLIYTSRVSNQNLYCSSQNSSQSSES
jgi:hypothetical protein